MKSGGEGSLTGALSWARENPETPRSGRVEVRGGPRSGLYELLTAPFSFQRAAADGSSPRPLSVRRLTSPLEEPLPLPTEWVEGGDAGGRKGKIVSEEDSRCAACSVEEAHASQAFWIVLPRSRQGQASRLIAANSGRICPGSRGVARKAEIVLGPNPQGGASWRDDLEASPVETPPIPDLKGAGLDDETLLQVDIGALSLGDLDDGGDRTPQVRQGVPFDGPLALAKLGPEKPAQAPIAGCRVEGRDRRLQLQTELLVGLQASGFHHELLRPVGVDAPVSAFVSLGQRAAGHLRPKPQGIEPLASGAQAGLDLAQAFPGRQRREGQGQKLAAAREAAPPAVFCSGSTRRWNGSRSRPSVRWAKTVRLGLMPRDGTLPLSV